MTGVLIGSATFARQLHMAANWTNPVDLLKGHLRPYRGVWAAIEEIWNLKETSCLTWLLPISAYRSFKIDRLAPEMTIFKERSLHGKGSHHGESKKDS